MVRLTGSAVADEDAAQSGAIGANEETWMETTVIGPGSLTFRYKLESGDDASFSLRVDGDFFWSSSNGNWAESGPHSIPSGTHTLRWRYAKGSGGSSAGTAWVDIVEWTGDVPEPNEWQTTTYTYDPAGRRIAKAFDGDVAIRYVYDGAHCIAEYDANDVLLRKFLYGPGVDQPICMIEVQDASATYYYHFDGLGSVVALSDAAGDTVQTYEYSVYGEPAASDPNHPNPFLFTARRFDPETGLYHYRARVYNPYIGRFLQTDPVGYAVDLNLYRYCYNNPANWRDPQGLESESSASLPAIPRVQDYPSIEEAAKAASAFIVALQALHPDLQAQGIEYLYWIYKYPNPAAEQEGEPCEYYGFTLPYPAGYLQCDPCVMDTQEKEVPSYGTIVGAGHSHPYGSGGEHFSVNDVAWARFQAIHRVRDFRFYVLTPSNRLLEFKVRVVTTGSGRAIGTAIGHPSQIMDFDPRSYPVAFPPAGPSAGH